MTLDRTDFGILRLLQNNASLSNKQIAAEVGLAPSSAHERLKRLHDDGVLRGAHADVNPKAMGIGLEALFLIELSKHERGGVDRFMTEVINVPEVRSATSFPSGLPMRRAYLGRVQESSTRREWRPSSSMTWAAP